MNEQTKKNGGTSDNLNSLVKCQEENERLRSAIKRLGSMEAFTCSHALDKTSLTGKEFMARIAFANEALNVTGELRKD